MTKSKLCPVAFGLSLGLVWGASVFGMGMLTRLFMNGKPIVAAIGQIYLGYTPSFINSVIGGLAGLVAAFIGGYIVAWLYNIFCEWPASLNGKSNPSIPQHPTKPLPNKTP